MRDLNYAMSRLCSKHRDGSFGTQAARSRNLSLLSTQLHELGFKHMNSAEQLKPKHVWALVNHWQKNGVSVGTIKNRMASIRWVAAKTNNEKLIAKDNSKYGIEMRSFVSNTDKSLRFEKNKLSVISDPHVRLSAELQKEFGLRREEAMKFVPSFADQGDKIVLKSTWTKGGKEREIPIRTEAQRAILEKVKAFVGGQSMIPSQRSYIQHMRIFEKEMREAGLGKTHGARHLYAQQRYKELTGRDAPCLGGVSRKELSKTERDKDDEARLIISRELGHERIQIVSVYVGS